MRWPLVVETISVTLEADAPNAGWQRGRCVRRRRRARQAPIGGVSRRERILCKGMQDIGEEELLVLLLVMQPDLQDAQHLGELRLLDARQQPLDSRVDVGAKRRDVFAVWAREDPAPWPRVARAG